ncbi:uncharacterized protein [Physcomitrium patens]|uniref:uncharacterized protein isoform X2 n=1 Tax=Physcomitrium patens TaxID=3218 RepID=UPI000D173A9D|nr:keratin-associated protein 5-5-like isoform X2 [Physcomitrium patens]XP_024387618.1 keratin-associated protein 5-5-like isoform X2 [Physcomitrium patens]|eukprot:XP_024387617.1 keratin-associated protein 5-5-like isoform X2 [Physcomitrella patens]
MSCGGCGCCPKCGCRATCTYAGLKPVVDDYEGQYNFNGDSQYFSPQSCYNSVAGENKCGNCDCAGTCAKEGGCNGGCGADCGCAN